MKLFAQRLPDSSYVGERVGFEVREDWQREEYRALYKEAGRFAFDWFLRPLLLGVGGALLLVMFAVVEVPSTEFFLLVVAAIVFAVLMYRSFMRTASCRKHGIAELALYLKPGYLAYAELFGLKPWTSMRSTGYVQHRAIKGMQWVRDGLFVEVRKLRAPSNSFVVYRGVFDRQESIDAVQRWADAHGLTIEGVPPLPGGYVRPVDSARSM